MTRTAGSILAFSLVAGSLSPTASLAQTNEAGFHGFEEIVVTARKREERLRDVPDAITAFTAQDITRSGIQTVSDVASLVPNFSIVEAQQPGTEFINIRGVGQIRNGEPPVAVVIDGVQLSSGYQITQDLFDVEQIEVLKGPQGAVYGRNAIGGAINITTRQPGNELEGAVRVGYGTGEDFQAKGYISGALIEDKLLVRLSGSFRDFGGDIDNLTLNEKVNFDESKNFRARVIGYLSEQVSVDLRYTRIDQEAGAAWYSFVPPGASINETQPVTADVLGRAERVLNDLSAKIDVDLSFATLTSITAYSKIRSNLIEDFDFFPASLLEAEQPLRQKSWSQEVRLVSDSDGPARWLVGGYYLDTDRDLDSEIYFMPGAGGVLVPFPVPERTLFSATRASDDNKAYALFGQLSYRIVPAFELSGALRYDIDERSIFDRVTLESFDKTFKSLQPKVQATYFFSTDAMAYLSAGRGFRSGGFNPNGRITRIYDKETNWNFELGTKLGLLDDRLLVNAAAFYTRINDRQVYNLDLITAAQTIANPIPKSEIMGVEADITARPFKGFELRAAVGLLDSKIKKYDPLVYVGLPIQGDFTGNKLQQTPHYSYAFAAQYSLDATDELRLIARGEMTGDGGDYYWEIDNQDRRENITLVNARLTAEYRNLTLTGHVSNLLKKDYNLEYISQAFSGAPLGNYALPAPGRRFGIEAGFRF